MDELGFNKIAAAVLTAGIIAMVSGVLAGFVVHPKPLEKNVYVVAGVEAPKEAAGGEAKGPEPIAPLIASADPRRGPTSRRNARSATPSTRVAPTRSARTSTASSASRSPRAKAYQFSDALKGKHGTWTSSR